MQGSILNGLNVDMIKIAGENASESKWMYPRASSQMASSQSTKGQIPNIWSANISFFFERNECTKEVVGFLLGLLWCSLMQQENGLTNAAREQVNGNS